MNKIDKYRGFLYILGLFVITCFIFFSGLGDYRLIDVDETRYINIAQNMYKSGDFITPYLNFEPFLEKPPLFYWLTILSYKIFGDINSFTSRFPVALLGMLGVFGTYFFVLNILKSRSCAFISALVLSASFWWGLFSHIAILDLGFCVFTTLAFYFGVSALFVENEAAKKILWYTGYAFLGLSVLQKGLIGIVVPGVPLLLIYLIFKRAKEIVKPSYITFGILIFLLITLPWHYLVFKENGMVWFNEYIVKHHFARFLDSSMNIGRKRPFLFYIPVILAGFLPWTMFFIAALIKGGRYCAAVLKSSKILKPLFSFDTRDRALILISFIYFITVFVFFSISSTKLPTYILTIFPSISILTGYFIWGYIKEGKHKKYIEIAALITFLIFLSAAIFGIFYYSTGRIAAGLNLAISVVIFGIAGLIFLAKGIRIWVFGSVFAFGFLLFGVYQAEIMNYVTSFGQDELEYYAQLANDTDNSSVVTLGFARKYSMLNYYKKGKIYFIPDIGDEKYIELKKVLAELKNRPVFLIVKNKKQYENKYMPKINLIEKGKKYTLYKIESP